MATGYRSARLSAVDRLSPRRVAGEAQEFISEGQSDLLLLRGIKWKTRGAVHNPNRRYGARTMGPFTVRGKRPWLGRRSHLLRAYRPASVTSIPLISGQTSHSGFAGRPTAGEMNDAANLIRVSLAWPRLSTQRIRHGGPGPEEGVNWD